MVPWWAPVAAHRHHCCRWRPAHPLEKDRSQDRENGEAEGADLGGRVVPLLSGVQEHHREQQDEHDQQNRAENRMLAAALECAPEPDHRGGMLQDSPARKAISVGDAH